eukprot:jgi/Hompol1/1954/HPOL_005794-RA
MHVMLLCLSIRYPLSRAASETPILGRQERDRRTVFCMQLAARLRNSQLSDFFEPCGRIREAKIVVDKNTGRSKGVAYVEFYEEESVAKAIAMTNQKLLGIPIIVQTVESERNRVAQHPAALNLTEEQIRPTFEAIGPLDFINMHLEPDTGRSKGFAFVQYKDPKDAAVAIERLNGLTLAGRPIRVNMINEKPQPGASKLLTSSAGAASAGDSGLNLDDGETEGVSMNSLSRAQLMAKLARTEPVVEPKPV